VAPPIAASELALRLGLEVASLVALSDCGCFGITASASLSWLAFLAPASTAARCNRADRSPPPAGVGVREIVTSGAIVVDEIFEHLERMIATSTQLRA
jgi:hypothetical protein